MAGARGREGGRKAISGRDRGRDGWQENVQRRFRGLQRSERFEKKGKRTRMGSGGRREEGQLKLESTTAPSLLLSFLSSPLPLSPIFSTRETILTMIGVFALASFLGEGVTG